jgi:hypothetical protein
LQHVTKGLGKEFMDIEQAFDWISYQLSLATNLLMTYQDD